MNNQNFVPQIGMDVFGSDGEKVGNIDAVEQDYFVVSKGFFFPKDHYIPLSAVNSFDDVGVYLNVTKDGALEQNWDTTPVAGEGTWDTNGTNTVPGSYTGVTNADVADPTYGETAMDDRARVDADGNTIEVREEDLHARTREVDRGAVRVDKHVVEEQQTLEVPVVEEEVEITRRAVDRPADGIVGDFEDTSFEVPVKGEEVDVTKTARVTEEIDIDKTARERTETVSDTVRREEVDISGEGLTTDRDVDGRYNDDRSLLDKAKDAVDPDDDRNRR